MIHFELIFVQGLELSLDILFGVCLFVSSFLLFRAACMAYGSSQARGQIRAIATSHSHSNTASRLHLQSIPQLMETPDL